MLFEDANSDDCHGDMFSFLSQLTVKCTGRKFVWPGLTFDLVAFPCHTIRNVASFLTVIGGWGSIAGPGLSHTCLTCDIPTESDLVECSILLLSEATLKW